MVTRAPRQKRKMSRGKKIAIGVLIPILLIVGMFFFPNFGTMRYGYCRTFVELQEPYPSALQIINAYEDLASNMTSISYKRVDPFGLEAMNEIRCFFEEKDGVFLLKRVDINGKKKIYPQEDPEVVRRFNIGLEAISAYPPDLVMPWIESDDIKSYR